MNHPVKSPLLIALPLILAALLIALSFPLSAQETHRDTIQYLEDRRMVVLELTGASTASSVAITLLPGDVGTPIAEKLADLSGVFLVIVSALILEKYLVTITALITFRVLLPLACLLFVLMQLLSREELGRAASRLVAFATALFLLVPVSVWLSRTIEATYQDFQQTLDTALNEDTENLTAEESEGGADSSASVSVPTTPDTSPGQGTSAAAESVENTSESRSWWQQALDNLSGKAGEASGAVQQKIDEIKEDLTGVANEVSVAPEKLGNMLNHFVEAVAVLIVTSCVIPVLVFLGFYWLVKLYFSLDGHVISSYFRRRE